MFSKLNLQIQKTFFSSNLLHPHRHKVLGFINKT
jgi:hypothetical protein